MFTKHLFRVVIGFCGMIILGLISLVVIDYYKGKDEPITTIKVAPSAPVPANQVKPLDSKYPTAKPPIKKVR